MLERVCIVSIAGKKGKKEFFMGSQIKEYMPARIRVAALLGGEQEVAAVLVGQTGLAYHPALRNVSDGELFTITHVASGCTLSSIPIRGESYVREAIQEICLKTKDVRWHDKRPFTRQEEVSLIARLVHWIVVGAYARGLLSMS